MRAEPDVKDAPDAKELENVKGGVEYRDVSFHYQNGEEVLRHVDLTIAPGETLALVGPSGSGKTTLSQLLPRFYDVTGGKVTAVQVDASAETPDLGGKAAETLAAQLTQTGSTTGVDAITGSTMTSEAIFTAMDACLAQAQ